MVKKMTNNMSLKSLKISWWGQNSVAGHILLPSASGGSKNRFLMWGLPLYSWWVIIVIIYLSSGDPRQREDQHQQVDHDGLRCEHLLILGSHLPPYTSLPAQVLDSMLRILSNILIIWIQGKPSVLHQLLPCVLPYGLVQCWKNEKSSILILMMGCPARFGFLWTYLDFCENHLSFINQMTQKENCSTVIGACSMEWFVALYFLKERMILLTLLESTCSCGHRCFPLHPCLPPGLLPEQNGKEGNILPFLNLHWFISNFS